MERLVIAGFAGTQKTTLAKKYKNVIDLDSTKYAYDDPDIKYLTIEQRKGLKRKPNPCWPNNYIEVIKKAIKSYDFILVWEREDIIEEYRKNNIDFILCYPSRDSLDIYKQRYRSRGNIEEYVEKKMKEYQRRIDCFENMDVERIILKKEETLEQSLIKQGYYLERV